MALSKADQKVILGRVYAQLSYIGAVVLLLIGAALLCAGNYARTQVRTELSAQNIYFPEKGSKALDPKDYPGLQQYAGQKVDDGIKAKAYANEYIGKHLEKIAGGKTYAEVSNAAMKDPKNAALQQQKQSLFQGETLRGILLGNGYGYWMMGTIALYAAAACGIGAVVLVAAAATVRRRSR